MGEDVELGIGGICWFLSLLGIGRALAETSLPTWLSVIISFVVATAGYVIFLLIVTGKKD